MTSQELGGNNLQKLNLNTLRVVPEAGNQSTQLARSGEFLLQPSPLGSAEVFPAQSVGQEQPIARRGQGDRQVAVHIRPTENPISAPISVS